jgi:protein-S-isoprenylcysteine O-methyltransferase Ste14
MRRKSRDFSKLFGSGPSGLLISFLLLVIASGFDVLINPPRLSHNPLLLEVVFSLTSLATVILIVWSSKSLPREDRGNKLCTTGAFKYVRHPLYAAYVSVFSIGLAIYLNSYVYILWALLLQPIWRYLVRAEERQMIDVFGEAYIAYQKTTGQFLPKLR